MALGRSNIGCFKAEDEYGEEGGIATSEYSNSKILECSIAIKLPIQFSCKHDSLNPVQFLPHGKDIGMKILPT